ncbi:HotDog domain-containing protein, partial [Pseudomassariella vexata]
RSRRRGLIYSTIFLCVGISVGSLFRFSIAPPPLPTPGSPEDAYVISEIHTQASRLPLVQTLSSDRAWTSWDAYTEPLNSRGGAAPRVTLGAMSGSRGLPYQRVFHNASTGEIISVVYFGGGLAGWPGVVHGGALATVLDESLGRCAIKRFPARTGVTARLELTYKRPTTTNVFYVVKVRPDGSRKSDRKMWVEGHVETATGKVCIEAKALFVVPKGITLMPMSEGF